MSWTRMQMAGRLVQEFQDGWVVNLGVGMPTMIADVPMGDRDIIFHAENGVIGYGAVCAPGTEDLNLVNAGGQNVVLNPGASIVHHADSFALIRGGRMDVTVMGAYEVSANGDFANWKLKGAKGGGIGGNVTIFPDSAPGKNGDFVLLSDLGQVQVIVPYAGGDGVAHVVHGDRIGSAGSPVFAVNCQMKFSAIILSC